MRCANMGNSKRVFIMSEVIAKLDKAYVSRHPERSEVHTDPYRGICF